MDGRIIGRADVSDERVAISVEDHWRGIAPENLEAIFEPFFTTRASAGVRASACPLAAAS